MSHEIKGNNADNMSELGIPIEHIMLAQSNKITAPLMGLVIYAEVTGVSPDDVQQVLGGLIENHFHRLVDSYEKASKEYYSYVDLQKVASGEDVNPDTMFALAVETQKVQREINEARVLSKDQVDIILEYSILRDQIYQYQKQSDGLVSPQTEEILQKEIAFDIETAITDEADNILGKVGAALVSSGAAVELPDEIPNPETVKPVHSKLKWSKVFADYGRQGLDINNSTWRHRSVIRKFAQACPDEFKKFMKLGGKLDAQAALEELPYLVQIKNLKTLAAKDQEAALGLLYRIYYVDGIMLADEPPLEELQTLTLQIAQLPQTEDEDYVTNRIIEYFETEENGDYSNIKDDTTDIIVEEVEGEQKFPTQDPEIMDNIIKVMAGFEELQLRNPELKIIWRMPRNKLQSLLPMFDDQYIDYCRKNRLVEKHTTNVKSGRNLEVFTMEDVIKLAMLYPFNKGRDTGLKDNQLKVALSRVNKLMPISRQEFERRKQDGQITTS